MIYSAYVAIGLFTYLGLFGLAYFNWQTALIAVFSLLFVVSGWFIAKTSGNFSVVKDEKKKSGKILQGIALSFLGVLLVDIASIPVAGLLGAAFGSFAGIYTQSAVPESVFFSVGLVVTLLTAISETWLIIIGFANWFISRAGFVGGLLGVFLFAFFAHTPVDGLTLTSAVIGIGFAIQALGGLWAHDAAVPLGVHVVNNAAALGLFSLLLTMGVVR
ncbi:MAG: hypothetical protein JRM77_04775 [Nitrososphaerota archaeon]|nr:hypothetical protein [Nitrososphaerota archaeon]